MSRQRWAAPSRSRAERITWLLSMASLCAAGSYYRKMEGAGDERMRITDRLETGVDYYWRRSESWKGHDGGDRWWEWFVEISGLNGAGGLWIVEKLRHHGQVRWHSKQPRTLGYSDSLKLVGELEAKL
jgi:hypothetical protein